MGQLWAHDKQYAQAEQAFRKAIELNDALFPAYLNLAGIYLQMNKQDQAIGDKGYCIAKSVITDWHKAPSPPSGKGGDKSLSNSRSSYKAPARQAAAKRTCHLAAIQRKNMKSKNRDRDRGIAKKQFAAFLQAMAFNLKRLVALGAELVAA